MTPGPSASHLSIPSIDAVRNVESMTTREISVTVESTTDLISLADLREHTYSKNPGFQFVAVGRDRFLERILAVYKSPTFDYKRQPKVEFIGEPGNYSKALYYVSCLSTNILIHE